MQFHLQQLVEFWETDLWGGITFIREVLGHFYDLNKSDKENPFSLDSVLYNFNYANLTTPTEDGALQKNGESLLNPNFPFSCGCNSLIQQISFMNTCLSFLHSFLFPIPPSRVLVT